MAETTLGAVAESSDNEPAWAGSPGEEREDAVKDSVKKTVK